MHTHRKVKQLPSLKVQFLILRTLPSTLAVSILTCKQLIVIIGVNKYVIINRINFYWPFFVGPDMEQKRSLIRRGMIRHGIFRMQINRNSSIVQQVLTAYACNSSPHNLEMKVKFVSELGHDGGGLWRELVGCFGDKFAFQHMEGSVEKIPILGPVHGIITMLVDLSRTHILTGYFPVFLVYFLKPCRTCGIDSIADDDLLSSFYNFMDTFKADTLRNCAAGCNSSLFQQN